MINNKPFYSTYLGRKKALGLAGIIGLALCTSVVSANTPLPQDAKAVEKAVEKAAAMTDFTPDPAKRLSLENFIKGAKKLHGYLNNAVEKATGEDKQFLSKEKLEMERQLADPQAAYDKQFKRVAAQIKRLNTIKVLPPALVAQMNKHFLETEAGKAVGALNNESKKATNSDSSRGEIAYQLGIISQYDQVNYKSALRYFKKAVTYSPNNVDYLNSLASIYTIIEDHGSATKLYKDILKNKSVSPEMIKTVKGKLSGGKAVNN